MFKKSTQQPVKKFHLLLLVHESGPPKVTFRYHSGGVMLTYIFGKVNYSSFTFHIMYDSNAKCVA